MPSVQEMMNSACVQLELAQRAQRRGDTHAARDKFQASLHCFELMLPYLAADDQRSEDAVRLKCAQIRRCLAAAPAVAARAPTPPASGSPPSSAAGLAPAAAPPELPELPPPLPALPPQPQPPQPAADLAPPPLPPRAVSQSGAGSAAPPLLPPRPQPAALPQPPRPQVASFEYGDLSALATSAPLAPGHGGRAPALAGGLDPAVFEYDDLSALALTGGTGGGSGTDAGASATKRLDIARELLDTERVFQFRLQCLVELFIKPLLAGRHGDELLQLVKPLGVEQLLLMSTGIRDELQQRRDRTRGGEDGSGSLRIGELFQEYAPYLKVYKNFASHHGAVAARLAALATTAPRFAEFVLAAEGVAAERMAAQRFEGRGMHSCDVQSLLIAPVQRIPLYLLLLNAMHSATPPCHEDHGALADAAESMREVAERINADILETERAVACWRAVSQFLPAQPQLMEAQPNRAAARQLLHSGQLQKVQSSGRLKEYTFFLFDDWLVYGKRITNSQRFWVVRSNGTLRGSRPQSFAEEDGNDHRYAFSVRGVGGEKPLVVCAASEGVYQEWLSALTQLVSSHRSRRGSLVAAASRSTAAHHQEREFEARVREGDLLGLDTTVVTAVRVEGGGRIAAAASSTAAAAAAAAAAAPPPPPAGVPPARTQPAPPLALGAALVDRSVTQITAAQLHAFYTRVDPSKLGNIATILAQFSTDEIREKLRNKYGETR